MSEGQSTGSGGHDSEEQIPTGNVAKKDKPPSRPRKRRTSRTKKTKGAKKPSKYNATVILTALSVVVTAVGIVIASVPQRANLKLERGDANVLAPTPLVQARLIFHNYGQVDARISSICVSLVNEPTKLPDKPNFDGCEISYTAIIPPGKNATIWGAVNGTNGNPMSVSQPTAEQIQSGAIPILVLGRLDYSDVYSAILNPFRIFGKRSLNYCTKYVPQNATWSNCGDRPNYVSD